MSAGVRATSSRIRQNCITTMGTIMARVREVSTEKAIETLKKLEGKIQTLTLARKEGWSITS